MTEHYQQVIQDSAREASTPTGLSTANTDRMETLSNNDSSENLNPKQVLVKIKFTNGTFLKLPISTAQAETCTIGDIKVEQFSEQERESLKLICKGQELSDSEKIIDQIVALNSEPDKREHVVTIHAILPAMVLSEESNASKARKSVEFTKLESGESVDEKGNTPRAIKVQYESMKLMQELERMRKMKRMGTDEESPVPQPTLKTGLRRGQHQQLPSQSMMTNNTIEEVGEPYGELAEDSQYTDEPTMRTVDFDDVPSHQDNKMSIDGVESANPYPLYQSSVEEGSWSEFGIAFVVILIFGILGVIGACVLHSKMRKKGWMGILFGLLNKIVFAIVVQFYVKELSVWQFGTLLFL